jgi:hypothetical protein
MRLAHVVGCREYGRPRYRRPFVPSNRVFVSQETLDHWMSEGRVEVDGETMTLNPERQEFRLTTAVHFLAEVAGGGDEAALVGKVKGLEEIVALGGEHCAASVVLGDNAYEVVEGFLGAPIFAERPAAAREEASDAVAASGSSLAAAAAAALGEGQDAGELDALARFLSSR